MMELAGQIADGVVLNYLVDPAYNVQAMEALARGATKARRTVDDVDRPQLVVCSVDVDRQAALDAARLMVTQYLGQYKDDEPNIIPHNDEGLGSGIHFGWGARGGLRGFGAAVPNLAGDLFRNAGPTAHSTDPRCTMVSRGGRSVCQIRLMGILHEPLTFRPWPISQNTVPDDCVQPRERQDFRYRKQHLQTSQILRGGRLCVLLSASSREWHGEHIHLPTRTTSIRTVRRPAETFSRQRTPIGTNPFSFDTPCNANVILNGLDDAVSCFTVQLLNEESADAAEAFDWLKQRARVDDHAMALMGNSYGGMMTVLAERHGPWPASRCRL